MRNIFLVYALVSFISKKTNKQKNKKKQKKKQTNKQKTKNRVKLRHLDFLSEKVHYFPIYTSLKIIVATPSSVSRVERIAW